MLLLLVRLPPRVRFDVLGHRAIEVVVFSVPIQMDLRKAVIQGLTHSEPDRRRGHELKAQEGCMRFRKTRGAAICRTGFTGPSVQLLDAFLQDEQSAGHELCVCVWQCIISACIYACMYAYINLYSSI